MGSVLLALPPSNHVILDEQLTGLQSPVSLTKKPEIFGLTEKIIWDKMLRAMYGTQQIPTDVNYYAPAITKQNEIRNPFAKKN